MEGIIGTCMRAHPIYLYLPTIGRCPITVRVLQNPCCFVYHVNATGYKVAAIFNTLVIRWLFDAEQVHLISAADFRTCKEPTSLIYKYLGPNMNIVEKGQKLEASGKDSFDNTLVISSSVRLLDISRSHILSNPGQISTSTKKA